MRRKLLKKSKLILKIIIIILLLIMYAYVVYFQSIPDNIVIFEGDKKLIGQMFDLKIVSEHMWYLKGEIND